MIRRPDIIIFNPDEMRADAMGHMGNPAAVTPFLDAFAHTDAVSFRNAFCQNPVCVPSRCSFFTGLYPHVNGHRTMSYLLHPGEENRFLIQDAAGTRVWECNNDLLQDKDTVGGENSDTIFMAGDVLRSGTGTARRRIKSHTTKPVIPIHRKNGRDENGEKL